MFKPRKGLRHIFNGFTIRYTKTSKRVGLWVERFKSYFCISSKAILAWIQNFNWYALGQGSCMAQKEIQQRLLVATSEERF